MRRRTERFIPPPHPTKIVLMPKSQIPTRRFRIAFLAVSLGAVAVVHSFWLPTPIQAVGHGVANALGMEVRWSMFAHDPRGFWATAWALIEYRDGTNVAWNLDPRDGDHSYRQLKWLESAMFGGASGLEALGAVFAEADGVDRVRVWASRHPVPEPDGRALPTGVELVYDSEEPSRP